MIAMYEAFERLFLGKQVGGYENTREEQNKNNPTNTGYFQNTPSDVIESAHARARGIPRHRAGANHDIRDAGSERSGVMRYASTNKVQLLLSYIETGTQRQLFANTKTTGGKENALRWTHRFVHNRLYECKSKKICVYLPEWLRITLSIYGLLFLPNDVSCAAAGRFPNWSRVIIH